LGYFSNKKEKGSGNILGLYRSLLNNSGYEIFSKQKKISGEEDRKIFYRIENEKNDKEQKIKIEQKIK
jgi:hypothetical protein